MMNLSENIIYQNWLPTRFTDFVSKKYNMEREENKKKPYSKENWQMLR